MLQLFIIIISGRFRWTELRGERELRETGHQNLYVPDGILQIAE